MDRKHEVEWERRVRKARGHVEEFERGNAPWVSATQIASETLLAADEEMEDLRAILRRSLRLWRVAYDQAYRRGVTLGEGVTEMDDIYRAISKVAKG